MLHQTQAFSLEILLPSTGEVTTTVPAPLVTRYGGKGSSSAS